MVGAAHLCPAPIKFSIWSRFNNLSVFNFDAESGKIIFRRQKKKSKIENSAHFEKGCHFL